MRAPAPPESTEPSKPSKASRPRRLYAGCIVALAVFVIGAMLWRSPAVGYRATAELVYHPAAAKSMGPADELIDAPLTPDQVAQEIRREENIRQALTTAFAAAPDSDETTWTIDESQVSAIRDYLTVGTPANDAVEIRRLPISYTDQESDAAVKLVNAVADAFVERCDREGAQVSDALNRQRDAAREQTRLAQEQLASAMDRRNEVSHIAPSSTRREAPEPEESTPYAAPALTAPAGADAPPPVERPLNPDWVQLRDHLDVLTRRQTALSATRTGVHPEMKQLATEIDEFNAILGRTPKYHDSDSNRSEPDYASGGPASEHLAGDPLSTLPFISPVDSPNNEIFDFPGQSTGVDEGDRNEPSDAVVAALDREIESARSEIARAEEREKLLLNQIQLAGEPRAEVEVRALVAQRIGGGMTHARLLQLLGMALVIGLIVAVANPVAKADRILRRSADAERQLGVPVIGAISSDEGTTSPAPARPLRRIAARLVTAGAEVALIAVVVVFLVTLLMDRSLAATCFSDPLQGLNEALEATKQRLVGG